MILRRIGFYKTGVTCLLAILATMGSSHAQPATAGNKGGTTATAPQPQRPSKPLWADLTPAQQQALQPLAEEWNKLDSFRKSKWLAIGNKFASMKPEEQQRLQERMRDWIKLTPEQRRIARESYSRAKRLNADQKSAQWEQYQKLPEDQKKKLAADAANKKRITTLPPPSQTKGKTVPPIKSAPKPLLERSLTPQVAKHPALQPEQQPQPSK